MKQALTKLFKKTNIEPIFVGLGIFLILTFLIFPGLTASDTLINIISALGAVILGLFVFYYLGGDKFKTNETEFCEAGETELDYIPQEELKTKTKTKKTVVPKQTVKKSKPLVEGKTKSQSKKGTETTKATPPPKPSKVK
jgi:hypothetical protein